MEIKADGKESSLILLKQGAEATTCALATNYNVSQDFLQGTGRVFESNFVGRRCVVKERFSKKYRHPSLDSKLTLKRLNAEARCMTRARRLGVATPVLYSVDPVLQTLTFEYVEGPAVKDVFLDFGLHGVAEERMDDIAKQIGDAIGKLHDGNLIHGDLTTSNMLIQSGTNQLVLIDFGLSFTSTLHEDKAVDLYVLERALLSMHSSCGNVMDRILAAYRKSSKQWSSTLNKLAQGAALLSYSFSCDKEVESAQWLAKPPSIMCSALR
ncbi:EKC/KEOPS complex subunit bud32 [Vitis vinifera]|uniref:non-specific serine/threonine protein kinase n=1 Tax=Vitis vinifera TaxID=29760 RepID=A0A438F468_VITVI|nr:EKC/KEOPS complex subunit bud32 [Vitis vinifera]